MPPPSGPLQLCNLALPNGCLDERRALHQKVSSVSRMHISAEDAQLSSGIDQTGSPSVFFVRGDTDLISPPTRDAFVLYLCEG